jgi:diguanylate cyclase (GGDEF)-like protein/PAS domain S-box-containing protein
MPALRPRSGEVGPRGSDGRRLRSERDAALWAARAALGDMTRLTRLLTTLSEPGSIEELLDRTVVTLSELFAADIVALLTPADIKTCRIIASIGFPDDMLLEPVSYASTTALSAAMSGNQPFVSTLSSSEPGADRRFSELGVETIMWVPMRDSEAAVIGVIVLGRGPGLPFGGTDSSLLVSMAHRIGLAIEQAQRSRQLEYLARSAQAIGHHLEESVILQETVRILPDVLYAHAASIVLVDPRGTVRAHAHSGLNPEEVAAWHKLADAQVDGFNPSSLLRTGQQYQTPDLQADPNVRASLPAAWRSRSMVGVPLTWDGSAQGMLLAYRLTTGEFSRDTVQMATLYASQVSAALENARLLAAVRTSDDRFRALVGGVSDVIAILGADSTIRYTSQAVQAAWACASDDLLGRRFVDLVHPDDVAAADQLLRSTQLEPGTTLTGGLRLQHGPGWRDFEVMLTNQLDDPAVAGLVATCHDITERKAFEIQLSRLAFRDSLSGLPNRALFMDRLAQALGRAARDGRFVAVLFLDLDDFKRVNDSLGHASGDAVLIEVANRLKLCLRATDSAARLGGDEFTILVEDISGPEVATELAERLGQVLLAPIHLSDQDLFVGASIGIALSTREVEEPIDLLHRADVAMYRAKANGKGQYALFDVCLDQLPGERRTRETPVGPIRARVKGATGRAA